jgi:hypothetical protein
VRVARAGGGGSPEPPYHIKIFIFDMCAIWLVSKIYPLIYFIISINLLPVDAPMHTICGED